MLISKFGNSDELLNIKEFETRLNINLPQQYIIFMQKYNGGETPDTIWSGKGKCDINEFVAKCKSKRIGHISTIDERKERLFANGHGDKLSHAMLRGWQAEIDKYANIVQEEVELTSV